MKKKLIAALLAASMLLSMIGCGKEAEKDKTQAENTTETVGTEGSEETETAEPKEPVTITYRYCNMVGEQEYTDQVEEKLNEILKGIDGYEHITIDLIPGNDYATEFTLAQASGEQIDLFSTFGLDMTTLVSNGDVMSLEDLLAAHPGVVSDIPDWLVEMGKIFGTQYMIPTYQQAAKLMFLYMPTVYLDMYYEATNSTREDVANTLQYGTIDEKLDMYEEMLVAIREGTGKDTKYLGAWSLPRDWFNLDDINADDGNLTILEGQGGPVYWPLTEEYRTIQKRVWEWYHSGLMHPDALTYKRSDYINNNFLNDEAVIMGTISNACSEENMAKQMTDQVEVDAFRLTSHAYIPAKWAAGGNAIYTDCEHPDEAMMIIELLMTEKGKEFYNTLIWGIEGIHYEWVDKENERIETLEFSGSQGDASCSYTTWNWNTGNTFMGWKNQSVADGFTEYIENEIHGAADTVISPVMGITWDLSSIKDQLAQCKAVDEEYGKSLYAADDFDARYEEYVQKLEAAGVQEVIDCVTEQYNNYLASK